MTNSADPDQLQKPTDLDLHCLLRQGMTCSAREGLIIRPRHVPVFTVSGLKAAKF